MNSMPALVLSESDASRSFVSTFFYRCFSIVCGALDRSLKVSIDVDRIILVSEVYRDCVSEIFGVGFLIDLIPIATGDVHIIAGMDWLSRFGELIESER